VTSGEWLTLAGAAAGALAGASGVWAVMRFRINKNAADLNGMGRKFGRSIAYQLRALAEDEPISKSKLMHLADLIDPR
jgi:hypothetical protein